MPALQELIAAGAPAAGHNPWPRVLVDDATWREAAKRLAAGALTLLGEWADDNRVHMALLDEQTNAIAVLSVRSRDGRFPSVGEKHAPAIRLERAIGDLTGLQPEGALDKRPWLDHGRWGVAHPLGAASAMEAGAERPPYAFLQAEGEGLHQIPVGPVHAGIIEPGHFRFTANGETVVRLEERLGYVHKGIETLLRGSDIARAAKLAGRTSGDSTVAYAYAFARAVEAALGADVPPRAVWLRALMAELERIANHLGDFGAICNDAAFALMLAQTGILRERVLRACDSAFGHRLMMDGIVPGGVAVDLSPDGEEALRALVGHVRRRLPGLVELYDKTASLQDRTMGTGVLSAALARRFGAGGFVGRASGRGFDARQALRYPPYDALELVVPVESDGDVDARVWIRIKEIEQSLALVEEMVGRLPSGPIAVDLDPRRACEGGALVEGFRGDILAWVRLATDGRVARCHLRDPSWFQWPLLEAVIEDNIVADFPLCNKSFNCSYSGHDV
jgi:Ni,Fe-hydrogenase III large subunit